MKNREKKLQKKSDEIGSIYSVFHEKAFNAIQISSNDHDMNGGTLERSFVRHYTCFYGSDSGKEWLGLCSTIPIINFH